MRSLNTAENEHMSNQTRQPRGVPTGGEFAANSHDEAKPWEGMSADEHREVVSRAILETLASHDIYDWRVRFSTARKTLGSAQFRTKEIRVSTLQFAAGRKVTMDTAMHEVAHVIAGAEEGHGEKWKAVARRLGATPRAQSSDVHIERNLGSKAMKTRYGSVLVVEGETRFEFQGKMFTVMEARNTKVLGTDDAGHSFLFDADRLHENYGDISKMAHGRTRRVKTRHGMVEATEGKTRFSALGKDYTLIEVNPKSIVGIDASGRRLRTSVDRLHDMDSVHDEEWARAIARAGARKGQ